MQRFLTRSLVPLAVLMTACSSTTPSDKYVQIVDSFLTTLNERDFDALYELHSAEFRGGVSLADAKRKFEEFRTWAGTCERVGEPSQEARGAAGRHWFVVQVKARCDVGDLEQEFFFERGQDAERISVFRWKEVGAMWANPSLERTRDR